MHEKQVDEVMPPKDYEVRRKRIWKGKFAPQGFVWITISLKNEKHKYVNAMMIEGNTGQENEDFVAEYLRQGIKKKFNV